jgi:hypothetical protein
MVMTTYNHMFPDTRNKNIYGSWVGISTVFKILEHFQSNGDGIIKFRVVMISIGRYQILLDTRNNNIYGLWLGISSFQYIRALPVPLDAT